MEILLEFGQLCVKTTREVQLEFSVKRVKTIRDSERNQSVLYEDMFRVKRE